MGCVVYREAMERTLELDKHWSGFWWCCHCRFYTGQLILHQGHVVIHLLNRYQEEPLISLVATKAE